MADQELVIKTENDLKSFLYKNHMKQIENFLGDEKAALKFLSSMVSDVQRNPKLLKCTPTSLINSYMIMAQFGFMPSGISGESYVLPYENSKKVGNEWVKVMEAQFQMGYQGFVTLFYRAGIDKITSAIVRKEDKTRFVNGVLEHEVDISLSREERGPAIGAYVIITFRGIENLKYMNGKDIIAHAARFSKSYDPKGKYSPWNPENDPELWQWMKTVIKQHAKLLPKNETIQRAIAVDNKDSVIADRLEAAKKDVPALSMGEIMKQPNAKKEKGAKTEEGEDVIDVTESSEENGEDRG